MSIEVLVGIALLAFWSYLAFKRFSRKSAVAHAYHREIHNLLTNKKYQVKGRFD